MVVSNIFCFHPYLGKWSNLTNIFQMGWNHQLDIIEATICKWIAIMHMYLFFCTNMIFFSFRDEYLWLTWNCPTNHTYSWSVGRNEASPDIAVQYHVSWHDEHHNVNDSSVRRDSGTINSKSEKYHCRLVLFFFTLKNDSQMISS